MARKFYINTNFDNKNINLIGDEHNHLVNVLRHKIGDEIIVFNNSELEANCKIVDITKNSTILQIISTYVSPFNPKQNVTVFQALVKNDKLDFITQKLTELGVSNLIPFTSDFCQVKRSSVKIERQNKISLEACKQCGRSKAMAISDVISFKDLINKLNDFNLVVFAYEQSANKFDINQLVNNNDKVAIIVGSEGGFSVAEKDAIASLPNVTTITLGKRILRAETACLALTTLVMFGVGEFN